MYANVLERQRSSELNEHEYTLHNFKSVLSYSLVRHMKTGKKKLQNNRKWEIIKQIDEK